jgi:5'(3')-deoxyribonucleotidase
MRIGLDADGCFYDFRQATVDYLVEFHGFKREDLPLGSEWSYNTKWGMEDKEFYRLVAKGIDAGQIFRVGEPTEGFVKAINWLRKKGHTIHICTFRTIAKLDIVNTVGWLQEHKVKYDSITFSQDKTILDVDVFLEDKPANFYALEEAGIRSFLFDQPYNQDVDTAFRVHSWADFAKLIQQREESCQASTTR